MDPPQFLLDALTDSVSSGTFVDTKFFAFSRREVAGRVGSPRALYCNSRILSPVPYFSTCGYSALYEVTRLTAPKYSQIDLLKGKRGISKGDSPPTQTHTPSTTITGPTATSKVGSRQKAKTNSRWKANQLKRMAARCRWAPGTHQTRLPSPIIHYHVPRQLVQARLKTVTGQLYVS